MSVLGRKAQHHNHITQFPACVNDILTQVFFNFFKNNFFNEYFSRLHFLLNNMVINGRV